MTLSVLAFVLGTLVRAEGVSIRDGMALVPAGTYVPFFRPSGASKGKEPRDASPSPPVSVPAFWMDVVPVTNARFTRFVKDRPEFRKASVQRLFADSHYLENWHPDFKDERPVTFVSWFVAKAYCEAQGKRLPTTDEWEYAARDQGRNAKENSARVLQWYGKPNAKRVRSVGQSAANGYGIRDLFGLVWEWTLDFNSPSGVEGSEDAFCAGGSQGAANPEDYASFMRFSFRSSLKGNYAVANLGFRCVKEVVK